MAFTTMYVIDFYEICRVAALRSLAKETIIYGMSYSLGRLINFLLVTVYLTRVFSEDKAFFSIYSEIYFLIAIAIGILTLRMESSFFRFVSDEKFKQSIYPLASQIVFLVSLVFVAIVYLFLDQIELLLQYPAMRNALIMSVWIIFLDVVCALPFSKLRYHKKALRYAWIKLSGIVLNVILVLYFLQQWEGSSSDQLSFVILANLISSVVVLFLLFPEIKESFAIANWKLSATLLNYAFPLMLVSLSFIFIQYGATSLLKYLLPGDVMQNLDQSSQYNAAMRLAVIMSLFVTAFNYAAEPFFFRNAKKEDSRIHFSKLSLYFVISCSFIYIATCLFLPSIALLLDKNFRTELFLVNILLMANIFSGLYANFSSWYKLTDRNYYMALISISGMVLMVALNLWWIPYFGNAASAYAILVAYIYISLMSLYHGQKHFPIPYKSLKMFAYLLCSFAISFLMPKVYEILKWDFITQQLSSAIVLMLFVVWVYQFEWKKRNAL